MQHHRVTATSIDATRTILGPSAFVSQRSGIYKTSALCKDCINRKPRWSGSPRTTKQNVVRRGIFGSATPDHTPDHAPAFLPARHPHASTWRGLTPREGGSTGAHRDARGDRPTSAGLGHCGRCRQYTSVQAKTLLGPKIHHASDPLDRPPSSARRPLPYALPLGVLGHRR